MNDLAFLDVGAVDHALRTRDLWVADRPVRTAEFKKGSQCVDPTGRGRSEMRDFLLAQKFSD